MKHAWLGKILYGMLFAAVLPCLLVLWARAADPVVLLNIPLSAPIAWPIAAVGAGVMLTGMLTLAVIGKGLPMNAFPPARFVRTGIYRFLSHPIYAGFCLFCFGASAAFGSPAGFWLVSPVVALACTALVLGYEREDLRRRFGASVHGPLLSLPAAEDTHPSTAERVSIYVLVLIPWAMLYEIVVFIGVPPDAVSGFLPFEKDLPVWEWAEFFYATTYVAVAVVPLVADSSRSLRQFAVSGLTATAAIMILFLAVPIIAPPREFVSAGMLGDLLLWERAHDSAVAAFPSFHVVWVFLAARVFARRMPQWTPVWWTYAVTVTASCILTGMHSLVDVIGALVLLPAIMRPGKVWESIRSVSERIANSWKEWRIGPMRIINHGIYGAVGTFLGVGIVGLLLGPDSIGHILIVAFSGLITAGLWAQFIEGSPSLLRPYGFYGGVVGIFIGCFVVSALGGDLWLLLGAYAVVGPLVQASGRFRCLVQGCCHGREASESVGIRYHHPRSRVCRLAHLTGVPIHPTPLYSILWNLVTAIVLARLWSLHAAVPLISGVYLILNGLGRFVEESYRGEPQTPIAGGLRLYQWTAIASVVLGAFLSTLHTTAFIPSPRFDWSALIAAFGFALVTMFALGVDFPDSNRRFSRLA